MAPPTKKSARELPLESPIAFHPCSNGEFCPTPESDRDKWAVARFRELVDEKSRRLGMSRRDFVKSSCGMAVALVVINQAYGCGSGASVSYDAPPGGLADAMEDAGQACELLEGDEFIFDIQVHTASPLTPWRDEPLPMSAEDFIRTVFVDSDTTVACLSGIPSSRNGGSANTEARDQMQEIIDTIGGPRLIYHVNIDPLRGPSELDYMADAAASFEPGAWKVYPHVGPWRLDDAENGLPFIAKARELGVKVIAAHRGIAGDAGGYADPSSPIDLVRAARMTPDVTFITYHSGWQGNVNEDHPFDPGQANPSGVDRLIKGVLDEGLGTNSNVYAELGSTWRNLMTSPNEAAHVFGKLLLYLGEDRIVWGTDAVFTGSPQEQIVAFRAFQIPVSMQEAHGYPALTDAIREKIFGLNAAQVYGVDPEATRCAIRDDHVDDLKTARLMEPEAVPVPGEKRYGPRSRREFLKFLSWENHLDQLERGAG